MVQLGNNAGCNLEQCQCCFFPPHTESLTIVIGQQHVSQMILKYLYMSVIFSKMWFWRRNEENKYPGELNSFPRRLVIAQRRVGELSSRHDQNGTD